MMLIKLAGNHVILFVSAECVSELLDDEAERKQFVGL